MSALIDTQIFGVIISILAYEVGLLIYRKTKIPIFNPLFISIILVISVLLIFGIDLETYNKGGSMISFFLGPATVILAVPLYKQLESLKSNVIPILTGITAGSVTAVLSVLAFVKVLRLPKDIGLSLLPKSITTPIGIELSKQIGGIPPLTVAAIVFTGIVGAVLGPLTCKVFRITDRLAVGVSIGTASHAVGTTKAAELGELEGAMSGLAIGLAGIITVFITLILIRFI